MIQGTTKVYGVIGAPIEHSMSPLMQNFYAKAAALDIVYVPFYVAPGQLSKAIAGAAALNIQGLNITVPYKQNILSYVSQLDETAKVAGAVNTLVRIPSADRREGDLPLETRYRGYNTDIPGLKRAMAEAGIEIKNKHCLILGAGGAAKAAAYVLWQQQAASVCIINRNKVRGQALAKEMNEILQTKLFCAAALNEYRSLPRYAYVAIQATSVGMYPDVEEVLIEDTEFYQMIESGVEIIYTPETTGFMKRVAAAGGKTINGLNMLLYQGLEAFQLWHPEAVISAAAIDQAREMLLKQLRGQLI